MRVTLKVNHPRVSDGRVVGIDTDGAQLEKRIRDFKQSLGDDAAPEGSARYEKEVAALKENPEKFDCGFYFVQKKEAGNRPVV